MPIVTNKVFAYPEDFVPDFIEQQDDDSRFLLGCLSDKKHILAVMGMNPSAATMVHADKTVARIALAAKHNGYDGWLMCNLYPQRATDQSTLEIFCEELHQKNIATVTSKLKELRIHEIWGAWGDLHHDALKQAKQGWLTAFDQNNLGVFFLHTLTKQGNPRHPLYLKLDFNQKHYL